MQMTAGTRRRRPSYQEILQKDPRPKPALFAEANRDLGVEPIPASRYTSPEFFQREVEKVWLKTWQYVCREEEIPDPGDTHVFDLVGKSLIVTRQPDGSIRAMENVCLHRGRKLVTHGGCKEQFRCPYHGFTWNTDGSFKENPFTWDFPQIDEAAMALPQVLVETWAGFVFVNCDRNATPLLEQLAPMPEHFRRWGIERSYKSAHVGKIHEANWKVCTEAFLEAFHVIGTHPQVNAVNGFDSVQTDILSDHVTRFMNPAATTPTTFAEELSDERRVELLKTAYAGGRSGIRPDSRPLEPGETSRAYAASFAQKRLEGETGDRLDHACEAELIDGISYDFFPNFHLWGGFSAKICYRFRPVGLDHEKTLMEVMYIKIAAKDQPKPPPAPFRMLSDSESWADASEQLGYIAGLYDQDGANMKPVQDGLRARGDRGLNLGRTLDLRVRHLHQMIDVYMSR